MARRTIEVRVVKKAKDGATTEDAEEIDIEELAELISGKVEHLFAQFGKMAFTYIVLDTARQVIVAAAKR